MIRTIAALTLRAQNVAIETLTYKNGVVSSLIRRYESKNTLKLFEKTELLHKHTLLNMAYFVEPYLRFTQQLCFPGEKLSAIDVFISRA